MDGTELHDERSHAQRTSKQDRHRNNCGRRRYCRRVRCRRRPSSDHGASSERFTRGRICSRELHRQRRLTARAPTIFGGAPNTFALTDSRLSFLRDGDFLGRGVRRTQPAYRLSLAGGGPQNCASADSVRTAHRRPASTACAGEPFPCSDQSPPPLGGPGTLVTHLKNSRQNLHLLLAESYRGHAGIRYEGSESRCGKWVAALCAQLGRQRTPNLAMGWGFVATGT